MINDTEGGVDGRDRLDHLGAVGPDLLEVGLQVLLDGFHRTS